MTHSAEWERRGYGEMLGLRRRHRILDRECIVDKLGARDFDEVKEAYCGLIEERVEAERFAREARQNLNFVQRENISEIKNIRGSGAGATAK